MTARHHFNDFEVGEWVRFWNGDEGEITELEQNTATIQTSDGSSFAVPYVDIRHTDP